MDGIEEIVANINDGSRKRKKTGRQAQNNRESKYADKDPLALNFVSACEHNKGKFKCQTLTLNEIVYNRKLLYEYY
ncbi:unnamed protein product [Colias eurytheme]|nr:unnamed protein product [Colias eurytheme]